MSWHNQYVGQSHGRIAHFIYVYGGFDMAERASVGNNEVIYNHDLVATFEFISRVSIKGLNDWQFISNDVPVFKFTEKFSHLVDVQQRKQREAILESVVFEVQSRIDAVLYRMHSPRITISCLKNIPAHADYIAAQEELCSLMATLGDLNSLLAEAKEHEFDFAYVGRMDKSPMNLIKE